MPASDYDDFPIREMMKAAMAAETKEKAVWAALKVLERNGGFITLPIADDGGGWHPDLNSVRRRYWGWRRYNARKSSLKK